MHGSCIGSTDNHLIEIMTYADPIPEIQSLGRFIQFLAAPTALLGSLSRSRMVSSHPDEDEDGPIPPAEDFPLPDGDEINPNREIPEEEEYLPDEEEVPVEKPPKEIEEDPYFPRKGEGLPPNKEEEFPKTDPGKRMKYSVMKAAQDQVKAEVKQNPQTESRSKGVKV